MNVGALAFHVQNWELILVDSSFDQYEVSFIHLDNFWLNVNFIWYDYSSFFLGTICLEIFFPAFYIEVISVFVTDVEFLM